MQVSAVPVAVFRCSTPPEHVVTEPSMMKLHEGTTWVVMLRCGFWGWVSHLPVLWRLFRWLDNRRLVRSWMERQGRQVNIGDVPQFVVDIDPEALIITVDLPIDAEALTALMEGGP